MKTQLTILILTLCSAAAFADEPSVQKIVPANDCQKLAFKSAIAEMNKEFPGSGGTKNTVINKITQAQSNVTFFLENDFVNDIPFKIKVPIRGIAVDGTTCKVTGKPSIISLGDNS